MADFMVASVLYLLTRINIDLTAYRRGSISTQIA
jgi:hypothetical protein